MTSSLPKFVVLRSDHLNKYLEYVNVGGPADGLVRYSGGDVHNKLSKFQVERVGGSNLVHIRCCYNNKYLMADYQTAPWIAPKADKPENDQSKWSCTLFQPIPVAGSSDRYWLKHVGLGMTLKVPQESFHKGCLFPEGPTYNPHIAYSFTAIDYDSLVVLPRRVAFKGDNGNYLGVRYGGGLRFLHFATSDSADSTVAHEVFPNPDGSIRIKSTDCGQFWRRSPNWIWADSNDTSTNDKDTLFWAVKLDDKTIALRNLGNNKFCKSLTQDGFENCLNAAATTASKEARLQVAELVFSRLITNVQFHPARARTYDERATIMGSAVSSNATNKENSVDVKVVCTVTESNSWNASVSVTLGVKTTLSTKVPFIAEGKIEISAEVTSGYEWGKVYTKQNTFEAGQTTPVPPMTKITVSAVGSTATCDIPYSYTQIDTLMDGTKRTYQKEDGIYTGIRCLKTTFEVKRESIYKR